VAGKDTRTVVTALIKQAKKLPKELYKSLTWDRGKELTDHRRFTLATKIDVYFCDPQSPWQRGSNENTNGLLSILKRDQHPALLMHKFTWALAKPCACKTSPHRFGLGLRHGSFRCCQQRIPVTAANCGGDCRDKRCRRCSADRVGVTERCVGPRRCRSFIRVTCPYSNRRTTHERTIRLTCPLAAACAASAFFNRADEAADKA
jgi:hypothetical protein